MSTRGRSPSTVEQNAMRQSGDNSPDYKSSDVEKNTTTPNQQRDSPTIQVTLRPTTNSAYMEDQQVLSHNSTERPTATYASTVQHQVMSQNTTTCVCQVYGYYLHDQSSCHHCHASALLRSPFHIHLPGEVILGRK
jgi:hypothetical protein